MEEMEGELQRIRCHCEAHKALLSDVSCAHSEAIHWMNNVLCPNIFPPTGQLNRPPTVSYIQTILCRAFQKRGTSNEACNRGTRACDVHWFNRCQSEDLKELTLGRWEYDPTQAGICIACLQWMLPRKTSELPLVCPGGLHD